MVHLSTIRVHKLDLWSPFTLFNSTKVVEDVSTTHELLADFKPWTDALTVANLVKQVMKGALLPLNLFMMDFNRYLDRLDRHRAEDIDEPEPQFDYDSAIERFNKKFFPDAIRFYLTSIIRKLLDEYCLYHYSARTVDMLTKDLQRSLMRKYYRNSTARFLVSQQILVTSLHCNALTYTSLWIYDIGYMCFDVLKKISKGFQVEGINALQKFPTLKLTWQLLKKTLFHACGLLSSSFGFAVGSYVHLKYGGVVGSLVCEALTMNFFVMAVGEP